MRDARERLRDILRELLRSAAVMPPRGDFVPQIGDNSPTTKGPSAMLQQNGE